MDANKLSGYLAQAVQVFQAVQTAKEAIQPLLGAGSVGQPLNPARHDPDNGLVDATANLVKIYLPEVGTGSGECIWALYLGNELYRLDNYPVNAGYQYGDLVRATGGGPGRVPYVIAKINS